jgi:hypothetical protein
MYQIDEILPSAFDIKPARKLTSKLMQPRDGIRSNHSWSKREPNVSFVPFLYLSLSFLAFLSDSSERGMNKLRVCSSVNADLAQRKSFVS